ncbi:hypothetical protein BC834DRAFT_848722 [Gloeopeniophorella convolvens]|nr:hypothetical protein BC834DRAFT_848722 [Gloeopeniophorella convolvens]
MRDCQMSSRGCDIVTHKDITKQIEALINCLGGGNVDLLARPFQTWTIPDMDCACTPHGPVGAQSASQVIQSVPNPPHTFTHYITHPIASMSDLRLEYLKYTDEQQDMLLVACRIIEAVRARDQGNAIPDRDFKKHLKREVDTAIKIKKRSLEHLSVHPAIKLASSLWEGETVTPLDELTMESITKACQKSKREGVLSSTDLEEVMIEDGELDRWWLPPAAEEMKVDEPEPPAKPRPTCALPKRAVLQVNTEGATQGAAEQEEGSSPTPQNTYITEEGTVNMVKKDYKKDWCSPCNYAKLECTIQPDAFETRNYECIRPETHLRSNKSTTNFVTARDLQKQIKS